MQRLSQCASRQYYAQLGRPTLLRGHARILWPAAETTTKKKSFSAGRRQCLNDGKDGDSKNEEEEDFEINWFEQSGRSKDTIKPIKAEEQNASLQAKIEKLERELEDLRAGKTRDTSPPLEEKESASRDNDGPASNGGELPKGFDINDLVSYLSKNVEVELRLPEAQSECLKRLNSLLREASSKSSGFKRAKTLWNQYVLCKQQSPGFESQLPQGAWELLWRSQYDSPPSSARSKCLGVLINDMNRAGQDLNSQQKLMLIEFLMTEERYEDALSMWYEERLELESNPEVSENFLLLGPRLEAIVGQPEEAKKLALQISNKSASPRVSLFIPVIEAWLRQGTEMSLKRAWALYLHVRQIMGQNISPKDYDQLVLCFLDGGQTELALGVFKDLVLTGRKSNYDSTELYKASNSLYGEILDRGTDSASLNKISLTALALLPRRFQNKFFYASWMKRLIGMGEIEAAASVLELMYHRGVRPDPKHINGLMGAWFRRGRKKDRELAIGVGWAMIKERLNFVAARRAVAAGQPIPPIEEDPTASLPPYLGRSLPAATIETFSILLLYYTRANMPISVQQLQDSLAAAEIPPNTYYMNHLLYSHLRSGDPGAVWDLFCTATARGPSSTITPDLETFVCLWDASKAHLATHAPGPGQKFPGPRTLYGRMANWLSSLPAHASPHSPHGLVAAKRAFSEDLYTQIIRCFCLARDLPGTLAALYSLRDFFGMYPSANVIRLVSIQIARSSEPLVSLKVSSSSDVATSSGGALEKTTTGKKFQRRRAARFSDNKQSQANLAKVAEVLEILKAERETGLEKAGVRKEDLQNDEELVGEENLWLLGAFLHEVMRGRMADKRLRNEREAVSGDDITTSSSTTIGGDKEEEEDLGAAVRARFEKVAWEMGVGGLRLGAPVYERGEDGKVRLG